MLGRLVFGVLPALWLVSACSSPAEVIGVDGGADAASSYDAARCRSDEETDNGSFCDGDELCLPDRAGADARGCVRLDAPPCLAGQTCDEADETCRTVCSAERDADGDGSDAAECGGPDCDDADPARHPGALELCDPGDVDEDCDPLTFGVRDQDRDGETDQSCCNGEGAGAACGRDCDDSNITVGPTSTEACDAIDNDCDGRADENVLMVFYRDADNDGFGLASDAMTSCAPTGEHRASRSGDCDDAAAAINPAASEICDSGIDNDCDLRSDENVGALYYLDDDNDGFGLDGDSRMLCAPQGNYRSMRTGDCDDSRPTVNPTSPEVCNGYDDNCDGLLDPINEDVDRDGFASPACGGLDCNPGDPEVHPGAPERCNRIDDDCDGASVEAEDADRDGYSPIGASCQGGPLPRTDCDDAEAAISPAQTEACNTTDDDCDGRTDEDPAAQTSCRLGANAATAACVMGACELATCQPPYLDCDGSDLLDCEQIATSGGALWGL